ncbi:MAG: 2OG-Fe(II) oxygenase [Sphingomonas sp.]
MLESAGASGNAAAFVELAILYLGGHIVPRDLAAARAALKRAVAIGHVDAALMEVALTANGSGDKPDWAGALRLLRRAAGKDPLAKQHVELLDQMALHANGMPRRAAPGSLLRESPRVERFAGFCTPAECAHIASVAAPLLQPATVFDPASGRMVPHPIRSSDNAPIGPTNESLVVQAINRRVAAATATDVTQGEPLTVLRYGPGQQYRPHLDTLPNPANQRIRTAILYLNHAYTGGETVFPLLDLKITPGTGDLLVFDNVDPQGAPDPLSRHAGLPVTGGTKWIATRWIRAQPTTAWALSDEARAAVA